MRFNSLQTGKWIQSLLATVIVTSASDLFPFPSNGKVDSELKPTSKSLMQPSFNSLQTGKWIQSVAYMQSILTIHAGFNSLQTGKWIQSYHYSIVNNDY